jgi:hypothetical protein
MSELKVTPPHLEHDAYLYGSAREFVKLVKWRPL